MSNHDQIIKKQGQGKNVAFMIKNAFMINL